MSEILELGQSVRRLTAPNPSAMTLHGTNTFLVGTTEIAVIDPGPADPRHIDNLLRALTPAQRITHILVTHSHLDHSPGARTLAKVTGAPVFAFGDSLAGRSRVMVRLAADGLAGGGEGVDRDFSPDINLVDGDTIAGPDWRLTALHTPGHMANHLCFALGETLFTGDHVLGWASSLISPPDGDLTAFMASCRRLARHRWDRFLPAHGDAVAAPAERLAWLIRHRLTREAQILGVLSRTPRTIPEITASIYSDIDRRLRPAAERNVFAHLIDLTMKNRVIASPDLRPDAGYTKPPAPLDRTRKGC